MIHTMAQLPRLEVQAEPTWRKYAIDTALALVGAMSLTLIIYSFHLYPRIPNISIVYLLIVLALASTRGRYAAILTSLVSFLSFDWFLVPPFYVLTINSPEEWIALFVFLVAALLTGQLAVLLRQRAEVARRREQETHILYEVMQATNGDEPLDEQLQTIAESVVTVFASWGVQGCSLLLPDAQNRLRVQASSPTHEMPVLSNDEQKLAQQAAQSGRALGLYDVPQVPRTPIGDVSRVVIQNSVSGPADRIRLIPLKTGQKVVGVLRLHLRGGVLSNEYERMPERRERDQVRTTFFWTFLDQITAMIERVQLRRERLRIEVLQRTDELRAALLSSVSHDLRTPLTSIKAAASSLQQHDVQWSEEEQLGFAQTIEREADRLNRLVGNLLDMSRIEGGALKPEKDWYYLPELIADVLARMRPLLKDRPIRRTLPDDFPPVEFDYVMMDQVLTNLIENANRYTPPDAPLDISLEQRDHWAVMRVADRGPGIPPGDLERVFDKFYRVKPRKSSGTPTGSGLGLSVCRGIVEAHGGRIWAENRPGGGAVFVVELPLQSIVKV